MTAKRVPLTPHEDGSCSTLVPLPKGTTIYWSRSPQVTTEGDRIILNISPRAHWETPPPAADALELRDACWCVSKPHHHIADCKAQLAKVQARVVELERERDVATGAWNEGLKTIKHYMGRSVESREGA